MPKTKPDIDEEWDIDRLHGLCESIKNRAAIAQLLIEQDRFDLLFTVLEDNTHSQHLVHWHYCIKEGN